MIRTSQLSALAFALAALSFGAALSGCKPKEGASCKSEGRELCTSDKAALACHEGTWVVMTCRGKVGCDKSSDNGGCDQSVAEAGDVCNLEGDFVCSGDKKTMLECAKHRWTASQPCGGERGCVVSQGKVACDNTTAAAGDACRDDEDHACTADKTTALVCHGGKFGPAALCKGPKGCRVLTGKDERVQVACDDSVAAIGDPCEPEGHYACALDGRSILRCTDKKFGQDDRCRANEKCQVKGDQVGCAEPH